MEGGGKRHTHTGSWRPPRYGVAETAVYLNHGLQMQQCACAHSASLSCGALVLFRMCTLG